MTDRPLPARDNPFATHRLDRLRFRPQGATWEGLLAALERLRFRAAVVGPNGSGKTALLSDLAPRVEPLGLAPAAVRLPGGCRRPLRIALAQLPSPLTPRHLLLVDGAEQLGLIPFLLLCLRARSSGGLVVTAHRPGRLPTLLECRTSPTLLAELVAELAPGELAVLLPRLEPLWRRHRGDLRACLLELYDLCAGR